MELTNFSKPNGSLVNFRLTYSEAEYRPYLVQCSEGAQLKQPITGFRAGKAPLERAFSVYGRALLDAAARLASNEMFRQAAEEREIPVVGKPMINVVENTLHGLTIDVIVPVYPEVSVESYLGMSVERPDDSVTEDDIAQELAGFCDRHRIVEPSDKPAEDGDIIYFSYDGTCGGEPFSFSSSKRSQIRLGEGENPIFPGLPEVLKGAQPGDAYDVSLTMPENFSREDVAGKAIKLHVEVQEVLRRRVPELTDALIAQYCGGLHTVAEYAEDCRERLSRYRRREADRAFDLNIENALAEKVEAVIPRDMIETQYAVNYRRFLDGIHASGTSLDSFLRNGGITRDELEAATRREAERQVRVSLALEKIAELESIEGSPDELKARYDRNCQRSAGGEYTYDDALTELRSEKAFRLVREATVPVTVPEKTS